MPMKNPPHPGEIIRDLYIEPLDLTVTQAAAGLGVSSKTLSLLLNGHAGISPEMAVRLSQAFGRTPPGRLAATPDAVRPGADKPASRTHPGDTFWTPRN